ncbi:MAG: hypothetical protein M1544_00855 [Candidatus Marsarchaeota archaeon]|nr:hypothetical protein [Candidatus Marsarchaeota archaeon]MCL5101894.1 hypothetical protein [Candidatus Marsarchaeota archaeon]
MQKELVIETGKAETDLDLSRAFKSAVENRNGNALMVAFREAKKALDQMDKSAEIEITYSGSTVKFQMRAKPVLGAKFEPAGVYYNSNESYPKAFVDDIAKLEGIETFTGISGGFTQDIMLLSILSASNNIRNATICDINGYQLVYNSMQLYKYDFDKKSVDPLWHIFAQDNIEAREAYANYGNRKIENMEFSLVQENLLDAISNAKSGRHFVYGSNAYGIRIRKGFGGANEARNRNAWDNYSEQKKLTNALESQDNIAKGSVYMGSSVDEKNSLLLRKEKGDKIKLYSYCDGSADHKLCRHMHN